MLMTRLRGKAGPGSFHVLVAFLVALWKSEALALIGNRHKNNLSANQLPRNQDDVYDLVIIGAGASGLFASGAATSFGMKTLLLDQGKGYVGGDCSNAACVPSKALRSIARMTVSTKSLSLDNDNTIGLTDNNNVLEAARDHTFQAVDASRNREDVGMFENATNLELVLVETTKFVSNDEIEIVPRNAKTARTIKSRRFLIATGASPFIPSNLQEEAAKASLPLFTYRDILLPDSENSAWKQFCQGAFSSSPNIVIAGGGATAVELGQSLARLKLPVTIVAPTLLGKEDVTLQRAACKVLRNDGVKLLLGRRVVGVSNNQNRSAAVLDDGTEITAQAMIVCVGRKPSIESLNLDAAGISWDHKQGVLVHSSSLISRTNPRVFACGDCCSAVTGKDRKASHAAWTAYHAVRNMALPRFLWVGSPSVHPTVPSVTFADPELASVGLTRSGCLKKFGADGFLVQSVREEGNDRADMERKERYVDACFVELRVDRQSGRILGLTACSPAAGELANEIGLAIQSRLTVRDLARSIHAYPSHGYLLYRLSLSMALSSTRGFLETLGPVFQCFGSIYGGCSMLVSRVHPKRILPWRRSRIRKQRLWEAEGEESILISNREVDHLNDNNNMAQSTQDLPVSFLEYYKSGQYKEDKNDEIPASFNEWIDRKP